MQTTEQQRINRKKRRDIITIQWARDNRLKGKASKNFMKEVMEKVWNFELHL